MTFSTRTLAGTVAAVTAGTLLAGIAPSAFAADAPRSEEAKRAAAAIERATGTQDLASTSPAPGGDSVATTNTAAGEVTVTLPAASTGSVTAVAADGATASLNLPETKNVTAVEAGNGTVVYPDAAPATDLAVQATTDGGARALATLKSDSAPRELRFTLDLPEGTRIVPNGEGGYDLTRSEENSESVLGQVAAPWAKDANGQQVPTSYRLDGNTVVQSVDTTASTAFPVVADPKWTWGIISGTVYLNRNETRQLAWGSPLGTVLGYWKGPLGLPATWVSANANRINGEGKCVKITYGLNGRNGSLYGYSGGYCR